MRDIIGQRSPCKIGTDPEVRGPGLISKTILCLEIISSVDREGLHATQTPFRVNEKALLMSDHGVQTEAAAQKAFFFLKTEHSRALK